MPGADRDEHITPYGRDILEQIRQRQRVAVEKMNYAGGSEMVLKCDKQEEMDVEKDHERGALAPFSNVVPESNLEGRAE